MTPTPAPALNSTHAPTLAPVPTPAPTPALDQPTLKQQYNLTVHSFKKLQNIETKIVFLSRCLKEKIVPKSFVLPLKLHHLDQANLTKARNTLNQTSRTLLRLALRSRKTEIIQLNKTYWDNWHILFNLAKDQKEEGIEDKLKTLETKITNKLTSISQHKFNWLKYKDKPQQPIKEITAKEKEKDKEDKGHRRFIKRSKWKRTQDKKSKEQISAVYNNSSLHLTPAMESILNRGLNFCVIPLTLNITNVLVDYRKFERSIKWKEFFANQNDDTDSDIEPSWKKTFSQKKNQTFHQTQVWQSKLF
jgi:hypothetical protein